MGLLPLRKYNLGCGNDIREGYSNIDLIEQTEDVLGFDLNNSWWGVFLKNNHGSATEILALDVIEHLDSPINFMDCCWDLCESDGILKIKACGWQNPNYWVDITHKRAFDIRSFDYFDPDTDLGKRYGYYTQKKWKILSVEYDRRKNVLITLTPRK